MTIIEKNFTHKGFVYTQIKRIGDFAIYSQTKESWKSKKLYYDVITIRKVPDYTFPNGTFSAAHEAYPPDSYWGKSAWNYNNLIDAELKLKQLIGK